ncbi:hypothetical protein R70006_00271 [Paraburkholderia domus]|nr:hypothetical protein R70006_00271 [Paraburkholderia domus]
MAKKSHMQPVPEPAKTAREAKLANFERLAARRVNEALKTMKLIGNLSNKRNYEYTDDHARQIIEALETELKSVKARFAEEKRNEEHFFEFKL